MSLVEAVYLGNEQYASGFGWLFTGGGVDQDFKLPYKNIIGHLMFPIDQTWLIGVNVVMVPSAEALPQIDLIDRFYCNAYTVLLQ